MRSTDITERLRRVLLQPSQGPPVDPLDRAIAELAQAVMGSPLALSVADRPSEEGWAASLGERPTTEWTESREQEDDQR